MQTLKRRFESATDFPMHALRFGIVAAGLSRAKSLRGERDEARGNWMPESQLPFALYEQYSVAEVSGR